MASTNTKILIGLGIGAVVIGALAYSSTPAKAALPTAPRKPPLPPTRRPGDLGPPAGSSAADAIAAAIAAAQGGGGGAVGPGGPIAVPTGLLLPNPAPLIQGQRYRSRLELSGIQTYGSREQIKSTFEDLGFANATVYMTQGELAASGGTSPWPELAMANVTSGSRWAEGTWNQASQAVTTPPQIKYAWTA